MTRRPLSENPPFAELFWAGYLEALHSNGAVTIDTPRAEVEQLKADFMTWLRGEEES